MGSYGAKRYGRAAENVWGACWLRIVRHRDGMQGGVCDEAVLYTGARQLAGVLDGTCSQPICGADQRCAVPEGRLVEWKDKLLEARGEASCGCFYGAVWLGWVALTTSLGDWRGY